MTKKLVLVETGVASLCLEEPSYFASNPLSVHSGLETVVLVTPALLTEMVVFKKLLESSRSECFDITKVIGGATLCVDAHMLFLGRAF